VNAADGWAKPAADATEQQSETSTARCTSDALTVGAFAGAGHPVPRGTDALGRWFLERHGYSLEEAFGTLLARLDQLERKAKDR
jgi:hypothetical protein